MLSREWDTSHLRAALAGREVDLSGDNSEVVGGSDEINSSDDDDDAEDGAEGDRHPQPRDNSRTFFSLRVQHSHGRHTHILRVTPREISVSTSHPQADSAKCTQVESEFLQTVPGS